MKKISIIAILLILSYSCGTANNPASRNTKQTTEEETQLDLAKKMLQSGNFINALNEGRDLYSKSKDSQNALFLIKKRLSS